MIDQRGTRSAKHVLRVAAEVFTVAVSGDHCALLNARLRDELVANAICKKTVRGQRVMRDGRGRFFALDTHRAVRLGRKASVPFQKSVKLSD